MQGWTVTVKKKARTFIVQHVGFLEDLAVAKATETASPPLGTSLMSTTWSCTPLGFRELFGVDR